MLRNSASFIDLFFLDTATNIGKSGDAANLTGYVTGAAGTVTALADTSASELDATNAKGWYRFTVSSSENNEADLLFTGKSSTSGVVCVGRPVTTTLDTGDAYARLGAPVGASISADIAANKTVVDGIKTKTDSLTFTVAGMVDSNVVDWKGATAPAMTGDAFARLGAPAGASIAADIATRLPTSSYTTPPTAAANASAVRTELTTELGRIDAAISSVSAPSAATVASAVRTELTTELGRLDAAVSTRATPSDLSGLATTSGLATVNSNVSAVGSAVVSVGSDVTAVKAKTDQITFTGGRVDAAVTGVSTLDAAGVRTAVGLASANLDTQIATLATSAGLTAATSPLATATALTTVSGNVDSVKTKTDQLTFGVTNVLNANITHVIADAVIADSTKATNWGGTP